MNVVGDVVGEAIGEALAEGVAPMRITRVAFKVVASLVGVCLALAVGWLVVRPIFVGATVGASRASDAAVDGMTPEAPAPVQVVVDATWFARKRADVEALDSEVAAVGSALAQAREDDRKRVDDLTARLLDLQTRRAAAVRDHDVALAGVPPAVAAAVKPLGH